MNHRKGLTARMAARRLNVSLHHLYELLWTEQLPAKKKNGRWLIQESAIHKRLREKAKRVQ